MNVRLNARSLTIVTKVGQMPQYGTGNEDLEM